MQCPSCASHIDDSVKFCPECGAQLASGHAPDGTDNVVYLPGAQTPLPATGVHIDHGTGAYGVTQPAPPGTAPPAGGFITNQRGERIPVGDFFSDLPLDSSGWVSELDDREPRVMGTMVASSSVIFMVAAVVVYALELSKGANGAVAGGFVVLSSMLWVSYLSLPRDQQHDTLLAWHRGVSDLLDRRIDPLRQRTQAQFVLRKQRDRARAIRDERGRRVSELGEVAYRQFRTGSGDPLLAEHARKVMAIEQQMLLQDARIEDLTQPTVTTTPQPAGGIIEQQADPELRPPRRRTRRRRRPRR